MPSSSKTKSKKKNLPSSSQSEVEFIPKSDDEETLYNVECILAERRGQYLVKWEGVDENGGDWPHDWVPKADCTPELVKEWKGLVKTILLNVSRN